METRITFSDANSGFQAGVINGPVEFHSTPERPEAPPTPTSTVPFRRDVDFVDRKTVLDQIQKKCAISGSWTALVGLGGVGKSQLAIEFAYRTREQSPNTWVFWVHASNVARFEQGFRDIANCVGIPERLDAKADIFQLVHDWLRGSKERWLLILDNVDDATFLLESQPGSTGSASKTLREYLPQSQAGSILVTTRSREAALKLVERSDIVDVDPMNKTLALELFEKKLGPQENSEGVAELAAALEFMPLAIVQAAAYVAERTPRYSVRQYLEQFQKSDDKKTGLLDHEGGWLRRDREAKNSIIITWQISFDYLRATRPSAADLLSLMCFFDRQGIPESLLKVRVAQGDTYQGQKERDDDQCNSDEGDSTKSSQGDVLEGDIVALRNFSFISINADGKTFEMHRLVQLATRKWLGAHGQLERWKQNFMRNLCEELPTGQYENWAVCQSLFPHAKSAGAQRPEEQNSLKDWASILYKAAWYAEMTGNMSEAENMSVQAMRARKKVLGLAHEDTLWSIALVADSYTLQGRWEEARKLRMQVMEMRKTMLGADHPDTLTSIVNLASTYSKQGRWEDAEELKVQVVEDYKRTLGADHLHTLISMDNLASTYRDQGRWREAKELQIYVMETRKMKLGADHPDTLTCISNLASTYRHQGLWKEAEELEVQVLEARKTKLGANHPDTLTSMSDLALTYRFQGRYDKAEELGVQVVDTYKIKLGATHPETLTTIGNLASIHYYQGQYDKAEELEVHVLEIRKTNLGVDHPDTLTTMGNLSLTYCGQGRYEEAEELGGQVLEIRKTKLGVDHPDTLTTMGNLAMAYGGQGQYEKAEDLEVRVLEIRKTKLGVDHPDTLTAMGNLAFTQKSLGRDVEAIRLCRECVRIREQKLGANHPDFISSSDILAKWEVGQEIDHILV